MRRIVLRSRSLVIVAAILGCDSSGGGPAGIQIATRLDLVTSAAGAASGLAFATQPVVALRDAAGHTVLTDNGSIVTVTVSTAGTPGTLVGTASAQALAGVASFTSLGLSGTAGTNYTLTFSRDGLAPVTQAIVPGPGTPAALRLRTNAAGAPSGAAFATQPVVEIVDAMGNIVTSATSPVAMTVSAGATLVGTTTAVAAGGVATFTTSGISGVAGTAYTLTFAATGLTATTHGIAPTPGAIATLTLAPDSITLMLQQPRTLVSVARDAAGNVITGLAITWTTSADAVASVSVAGLVTAASVGAATVTASTGGRAGQMRVGVIAFVSITSGFNHACGLTAAGQAYCWGSNEFSQLGDGTTISRTGPTLVQGGHQFASLLAGLNHTCGVTTAGVAYCWGYNSQYGQVGDGTRVDRVLPTLVSGGRTYRVVVPGIRSTCALTTANEAFCWGSGAGPSSDVPVAVNGGISFASLAVGTSHVCGRALSDEVLCWGSNAVGALGDSLTILVTSTPAPVTGGMFASTITAGDYHTCATSTVGASYCWGLDDQMQLGTAGTLNRFVPTPISGGRTFTSFAANSLHTCALMNDGAAYCWGEPSGGKLGVPPLGGEQVPVAVQTALRFNSLSAGQRHTCGLATSGVMYCWGRLPGVLPATESVAPVAVVIP